LLLLLLLLVDWTEIDVDETMIAGCFNSSVFKATAALSIAAASMLPS
jgi:hypothetical protein